MNLNQDPQRPDRYREYQIRQVAVEETLDLILSPKLEDKSAGWRFLNHMISENRPEAFSIIFHPRASSALRRNEKSPSPEVRLAAQSVREAIKSRMKIVLGVTALSYFS